MGNVLSAQIPNQILPVEAYLTDIADVHFVESFGSTRFMKVARVEHAEGPYVLKVFLLQDPSFSIEPYRDQVIQIRDLLTTSFNCCPFKRVYVTSRCIVLSRRFHKYTLYDRLTTRPYFAEVEKRWITFQLFKALAQCEAADVCHGDIKSQNVLVSSSNWVQIGDFASFKPSSIPSDDPSYFTFFFDTSRRLCCYLAPERFCTSQELNLHPNLPGEFMDVSKGLTHAMDIFSLGCVLAEMFSEGKCPFTYEMLVKYKHASDSEAQVFIQNMQEKVPKDLRRMIGLMLHRNPAKRPKASQLLQKYAPTIFPPIFDHFLYNYMNAFRPRYVPTGVSPEEQQTFVAMEADDVIAKLTIDLDKIMGHLKERPQMDGKPIDQTPAALLIISLITSNMRATIASKFEAMKLLHHFAPLLDADFVADRILPYMVDMLSDRMVQVRCEAVSSITTLLSSFKEIPPHETRLFIDYLFPRLKSMSSDNHHFVQMVLAQNLGDLAEISYRFMHEGSRSLTKDLLGDSVFNETDAQDREEKLARHEMKALQEAVIDIFVNLCGSDNSVKVKLISLGIFLNS